MKLFCNATRSEIRWLKWVVLYSPGSLKMALVNGLVLLYGILFSSSLSAQDIFEQLNSDIDQFTTLNEKYQKVIQFEENRQVPINDAYASVLCETVDYYISTDAPERALPVINTLINYYLFGIEVDHDKAHSLVKKIAPHLTLLPRDTSLIKFYINSGELNIYRNNPAAAINDFNLVIDICRQQKDTLLTEYGYAHLKLAEIYSSEWKILESDKKFNQAADLFLRNQDTLMYLWTLSGHSTLYRINGMYREAEKARRKILEACCEQEWLQVVAVAHLSAALESKDRHNDSLQYDHLLKARQYINLNLELAAYIETMTYALQIQYFADQNNIDSAAYFMNKFEAFYRPEDHGSWINKYYIVAQASYAKALRKYDEAERIGHKLIENAQKSNILTSLTRSYDFLVEVYQESGDTRKAFSTLRISNRLRDSLTTIQINNQFLYYNQLFQAEKKNKQILQQEASIQLLSEKNKVLFWRGALIVLVLSGAFLGIYLWRSVYFARQKTALQEDFSQSLIQQQEQERSRLSQELHDGISQELILIKNKLDHRKDAETANLVADTLTQIRQVTRSLYPVMLKSFGLKAAVDQLLNQIAQATPDVKVLCTVDDDWEDLKKSEQLHLFRIIQEATNNVLKYAKCTVLEVRLVRLGKTVYLEVLDNGIGMDLKNHIKMGIGMNSMEERAKILGGSFTLESSKNDGTHIRIKILLS
ncbi:hypothetical protein KUV50_02560 [Membranicola marinus]|uniref:histidine kinase n=1 Tax=Membranihabitans marinus TaxID=1227546 RepID=A0A953L7U8_9BACT|nr:sensor histidine kinase [Membranihabitans marinus]MBY5957000.1 hypothetical protein [Membranihabitans marinus]